MLLKKILRFLNLSKSEHHLDKQLLKSYNNTRNKNQIKYLCHAPFKSMLFTNNGRVLTCCFNRQAVLGEYPRQTIKEIWFNNRAENLRHYIRNNNLDFGCFVCKNYLLNKEFHTVKARMFDHLPENTKGYPSMMEFDLDNTCNLQCVMCNADNSSAIRHNSPLYAKYSSPYGDDFVEQLEEFIPYLYQASFAGGEPFLIKIYEKIWERMLELNPHIRITVTTNATVLNDKIKNILNRGFFEISVSVDSINKTTYETIRRNAPYEKVMENIDYFYNYCSSKNTYFGVWVCPLRNNMYEIPDVINYFGKKNIEVYLHTVWVPPSVTMWNLPLNEFKKLLDFYLNAHIIQENQEQLNNKKRFDEYVQLVAFWSQNADSDRDEQKQMLPERNIIEKFKKQYLLNKISEKNINQNIENCKNKLKYCKEHLPESCYTQAIKLLNTYPNDFVFQIFEAGTSEMICDFFKYLNR